MVLHKNLVSDNLHIPKVHTHVEADITDLDKYTQAEVDALLAGTTLTDLDDFPSSYTGKSGDFLRVNSTEDGVTFLSNQYVVNQVLCSDGSINAVKTVNGDWPADYDITISANYKTFAQSQGLFDLRYLKLTAGSGNAVTGDAYFSKDIVLAGGDNSRIYGTPGHIMAWYKSADDSMNFGTNGDILRLKGSLTRPYYEKTPGVDVQLALLSDVTGGAISLTFLDLTDTPVSYTGNAGLIPVVNPGETALTFVEGATAVFPLSNEQAVLGKDTTGVPRNLAYVTADDYVSIGDYLLPLRLYGSSVRPTYLDNWLTETELALLSDLDDYLPLGGGTLTGDLIMDWGTALQVDVGAGETPTDAVQGNSFGIVFGDSGAACQLVGSGVAPTYNTTNISLDGHTHSESDITDLGTYLDQAAADLLYSGIGHSHTESDITDLGAYLTEAAADLLYEPLGGGGGGGIPHYDAWDDEPLKVHAGLGYVGLSGSGETVVVPVGALVAAFSHGYAHALYDPPRLNISRDFGTTWSGWSDDPSVPTISVDENDVGTVVVDIAADDGFGAVSLLQIQLNVVDTDGLTPP